jgi:hypothetical protein
MYYLISIVLTVAALLRFFPVLVVLGAASPDALEVHWRTTWTDAREVHWRTTWASAREVH